MLKQYANMWAGIVLPDLDSPYSPYFYYTFFVVEMVKLINGLIFSISLWIF